MFEFPASLSGENETTPRCLILFELPTSFSGEYEVALVYRLFVRDFLAGAIKTQYLAFHVSSSVKTYNIWKNESQHNIMTLKQLKIFQTYDKMHNRRLSQLMFFLFLTLKIIVEKSYFHTKNRLAESNTQMIKQVCN